MVSEKVKSVRVLINELKVKLDNCDNNSPHLATNIIDAIYENVGTNTLTPIEGFEMRRELYNALKIFKNCSCSRST